jgi:hypothetical protein
MQRYTPDEMTIIIINHERQRTRRREIQNQYYQRKAEERLAYAKRYYAANKDIIKARRMAETPNPVA